MVDVNINRSAGCSECEETCYRCMGPGNGDGEALSEVAGATNRSVESLTDHIDSMPGLKEKASRSAERRLEEQREQMIEEAQSQRSDIREAIEQQLQEVSYNPEEEITREDVEDALSDFIDRGYLDWDKQGVKVTSRGAERLAGDALKRVLSRLTSRSLGPHSLEQVNYGSKLTVTSRKYELGDEYHRIDFEKTFLNAMERNGGHNNISLIPEDFQIFDELYESRMCAGLIIDESSSMNGAKMKAAVETALALSALIAREPGDSLKVYLFSSQVREIPYFEILNAGLSGGTTDIASALKAFRRGTLTEKGEKQAYLITDTEPNMENGTAVGFQSAALGVVREAMHYRQAGITLNIIMLDESSKLKELASIVAGKNQGRVFFTSPDKIGEVVIEDYLLHRKKAFS